MSSTLLAFPLAGKCASAERRVWIDVEAIVTIREAVRARPAATLDAEELPEEELAVVHLWDGQVIRVLDPGRQVGAIVQAAKDAREGRRGDRQGHLQPSGR